MICKNCGAEIADNTRFCQFCGSAIEAEAPAEEPIVPAAPEAAAPVQPMYAEEPVKGPGLVWGLLGVIFADTAILSLLGLIFSIVGLSKANRYAANGYVLTGKDKAGKILSIIGLVLSIVVMVALVIAVIAGVGVAMQYVYG